MKKCQFCQEDIENNAEKCKYCGKDFTKVETINSEDLGSLEENKPKGLGGWLILLGLGLFSASIRVLSEVKKDFIETINDGSISMVISPESSSYIDGFFPIFMFEILLHFFYSIFGAILLFYFFSKHKLFPLLYKIYLICIFIFTILDIFFINLIPETAEKLDYLIIISLFLKVIIWGAYIHVSKRVKNTFVNKKIGKINIFGVLIIGLIIVHFLTTVFSINFSKLKFNEEDYANNICKESFGYKTIYSGKDEKGEYLCDCEKGYEFGGIDDNKCVLKADTHYINGRVYLKDSNLILYEKIDKKTLDEIDKESDEGFYSYKENIILFLSSELDEEDRNFYQDIGNKDDIILTLISMILGWKGENIKSNFLEYKGINFFIFNYSINFEGEKIYYYEIYFSINSKFETIGLYGENEENVNSEGKFILDHLRVREKKMKKSIHLGIS